MLSRRKKPELSDDELAAQTLQNCRMSMMSQFQEQETVETMHVDDALMQEFYSSPEYRAAIYAFLQRRRGS